MKTNDVNKKTNRRGNVKDYFQRLIILMVTIMASTALAGCDIVTDDDNNGTPTGNIDSKLIGSWFYTDMDPKGNMRNNNYVFRENGTFSFFEGSSYTGSYTGSEVTGKYTTSKGKLNLTGLSYNYYVGTASGDELRTKSWANMVIEYSIGIESGTTVLTIPQLYETSYIDISQGRSFHKN